MLAEKLHYRLTRWGRLSKKEVGFGLMDPYSQETIAFDNGYSDKRIPNPLFEQMLLGIFYSHSHIDHARMKGLKQAKELGIPTWMNPVSIELLDMLLSDRIPAGLFSETNILREGELIYLGNSIVTPFLNHHHAVDNMVFHEEQGTSQMIVATDLGGTYWEVQPLVSKLQRLTKGRPIDVLIVDPLGIGNEAAKLKENDQKICRFLTTHIAFNNIPALINVRYGSSSFADWFSQGGVFDQVRAYIAATSDIPADQVLDIFVNPRLHGFICRNPEIYNLVPYKDYQPLESESQFDGSKPIQVAINDQYNLEINSRKHAIIHTLNPRNLLNHNNLTDPISLTEYPDHSFEATKQFIEVFNPKAVIFSHSISKDNREYLEGKGINIVAPRYKSEHEF